LRLQLIGHERPRRHRQERKAKNPARNPGRERAARPRACESGDDVVYDGGAGDACNDRQRSLKARREHEREELRLVAELADGDDDRRDE